MEKELNDDLDKLASESRPLTKFEQIMADLKAKKAAAASAPTPRPPAPIAQPTHQENMEVIREAAAVLDVTLAEDEEEDTVAEAVKPRVEAPEPIQGDEGRMLRDIEELRQLTANTSIPVEVTKEEWALLSNQESESLIDMIRRHILEKGPEAGKVAAAEELVEQIKHCKQLIAIQRIVWYTKQRTLGTLLTELSEVQAKEISKSLRPTSRPRPPQGDASGTPKPRASRAKKSDDEVAMETLMKYGFTEEQAKAKIAGSKK